MILFTCKSATRPPLNTHGSWSPLMKFSFQPFENPKNKEFVIIQLKFEIYYSMNKLK